MYISISDGGPTVREADDLQSLSVRVRGSVHAAGVMGPVDADTAHVWLPIATLRDLAAASITSDINQWQLGFDGMIAYASTKGWTSADGAAVRAHIVVDHPEHR